MFLFALATLAPVPVLVAGAWLGGGWALAAFAMMAGLSAAMDGLVAYAMPADAGEAEFPAGTALSVCLACAHFGLLALAVPSIAAAPFWQALLLVAAFGLYFGQVSNANAHELIHRPTRGLRRLGVWVYISLLFGHHASAHPLVHHRYVASDQDPSSAREGEGFYRFAARAWRGSFRDGLRAERDRLARVGRAAWWQNPYAIYIGGALVCLMLATAAAGWRGLVAYLALTTVATAQLLLVDYVQHYGLRRARLPNGKLEPVGPAHSWNAPHWYSSAMTLNAPRHSDHHAHPATPYPALRLPADAPLLPRSLQVMATLALFPRPWKRVMGARLAALRAP